MKKGFKTIILTFRYLQKARLILVFVLFTALLAESNVNRPAPNFYLKDLQRQSHFLNDYCGVKKAAYRKNEKNVVLLSFFATWCNPCRAEYKILEQLAQDYAGKRFKIFLIDVKEKENLVKQYAEQNQIKLPILMDIFGVASERYKVSALPRLFLIDPEQTIVYDHMGFDPDDPLKETLSTKVDSLLQDYFGVH